MGAGLTGCWVQKGVQGARHTWSIVLLVSSDSSGLANFYVPGKEGKVGEREKGREMCPSTLFTHGGSQTVVPRHPWTED